MLHAAYGTGARSTGGCNLDRALRAAPPSRVHVSFELLYVAYFFDLLALSCLSMQMEMYRTKLTKRTTIMRTVARPLSGSAMIWKHAAVDATADDHAPRCSHMESLHHVCSVSGPEYSITACHQVRGTEIWGLQTLTESPLCFLGPCRSKEMPDLRARPPPRKAYAAPSALVQFVTPAGLTEGECW